MANSWQYRTILKKGPELRVAFQRVLLPLSEDLLAEGLISRDNKTDLNNVNQPLSSRASSLVDMIGDQVKLDHAGNYQRFLEVLQQDENKYGDIIRILNASGAAVQPPSGTTSGGASGGGPSQGTHHDLIQLDRVIDAKHLGIIADSMGRWEGRIADELGLKRPVVNVIKKRNQSELNLQARDALAEWEDNNGDNATYSNLISVFKRAGNQQLADKVKRLAAVAESTETVPRGLNIDARAASRNDALPSGSGVNSGNMSPLEMPPESHSHVDIDGPSGGKTPPGSPRNEELGWCYIPSPEQSNNSGRSNVDMAPANLQQNNLWDVDELHVKFLDDIPEDWAFCEGGMNLDSIMNLATQWNKKGKNIPKIKRVGYRAPAHIRVRFTETEISGSLVGVRAQDVRNRTEPTMWLNLKDGGDDYKKYLVVHEFGHAFGLEHEHQRGDFWSLIRPYVNEDVMRNDPRIGGAFERYTADPKLDSNVPGHVQTDYDPNSVMHYWFRSSWLKDDYNTEDKITQNATLSTNEKAALLGILQRSNGRCVTEPSEKDLDFLDECYKKRAQGRGLARRILNDRPWGGYWLIGAIIAGFVGVLVMILYFLLK